MNNKRLRIATLVAAILACASINANAASQATPKQYGRHHPFTVTDLPEGELRNSLQSLSATNRGKAMAHLHTFDFSELDTKHLKVDKAGGVFYADIFTPLGAGTSSLTEAAPVTAAITATNAFALHSKPGSANVVYLDFNGHTISGTAWNSTSAILNAVPYDTDGIPSSFSDAELANIAEIWRRIAEDYAPFDIDITTQEPTTFTAKTARVLITQDTDANGLAMPSQGAGGVAYVNVWGLSNYSTYYSPALVYYNRLGAGRPDYVTEAASHELGHNLGLSHDGTSTLGYYGGQGTGYVSWGPIMGTGYNRNVSQWSKGEYTDANNTQDDVALIAGKVTTRVDDHANTTTGATLVVLDAAGNIVSTTPETDPTNAAPANKGIISSRTDVDVFTFNTAGGDVTLKAMPALQSRYTRGGDLDIQMDLYNSSGVLVASNDSLDDTSAAIVTNLASGRYYLSIQGVGNSVTPYSDYGSLGQYFLSGVVPPSTTPVNSAPVANTDAYSVRTGSTTTLTVLANDTDVDGNALTITAITQGTKGTVAISADAKSLIYKAGSKRGGDTFTYTISDGNGGTTKGTVNVTLK
ncbi:MAG: hypothetical protein RI964_877 [Pseudomonadota bacterium]|jgi:hypothetical protein